MKILKILLLALLISSSLYSQNSLNGNVIGSVFHLAFDTNGGTCFRITQNREVFLVTAKHIFPQTLKDGTVIDFFLEQNTGWLKSKGIYYKSDSFDVAAIAIGAQPDTLSNFSIGNVISLTQDCYFLGYPGGAFDTRSLGTLNGFIMPLIKKGIVSSTVNSHTMSFYVDGHNNKGFSGGPVFALDPNFKNGDYRHYVLIGVVSSFFNESYTGKKNDGTPTEVTENSGILMCTSYLTISSVLNKFPH